VELVVLADVAAALDQATTTPTAGGA
jgi:hypothetical protein